jgi:DNA topoisomerase I
VSHAGVNATLPKDVTPEQVTLVLAVELIDARAGTGGGSKRKSAKSSAGATAGDAPRARRPKPARVAPGAAKAPKETVKPVAKKKKAAK